MGRAGLRVRATTLIFSQCTLGTLGIWNGIFSFVKSGCTGNISAAVFSTLLYSAFVLDCATRVCFFELQETKLEPKTTQDLEVYLLSSGSPAQPTSQKAKEE